MKFITFLFIICLSCNGGNINNGITAKTSNSEIYLNASGSKQPDGSKFREVSNCIEEFNRFRSALDQNDKKRFADYFEFPIQNQNLWILSLKEDELEKIGTIKPFTEVDFEKYFGRLFSHRFITAFLKVKAKELLVNNKYETVLLEDNSHAETIRFKMIANYSNNVISLMLYEEYDDSGERYETTVVYTFSIQKDCKIEYQDCQIAG